MTSHQYFHLCCRHLSNSHHLRGDHEERESKRVTGDSSRQVAKNDDLKDYDYESRDEEMVSRERTP